MATTIKDIAKMAGVSYGTVSRVLNDRAGVSPKTRQEVLKLIKDLDYQPNAIARSLVTMKSNTIAFIVPDISSSFFGGIALAIDKIAFQMGYNTVLCNTDYDLSVERSKLDFVREKRVDGVIIKPATEGSTQFTRLSTPMVLLSHVYDGDISYVDIENRAGGEMAGEHLAKCGYKKMAFLGGYAQANSTQQRLKGFEAALDKFGIGVKKKRVCFGEYSIRAGYENIKKMAERKNMPDAVFCGNDQIALGVLQYAKENQINVPESLGVVGFDGDKMSALPQVRLTTIAQPIEEMGRLAAEMLIKSISAKEGALTQKVSLRPQLIVRSTTMGEKKG